MGNILEHYRVLGISVGAGLSDVKSSYKHLCRMYHPDLNDDPESEELMKKINIAYTVLRDKLRRDAAFRERQAYPRPMRRYPTPDPRSDMRKANAEKEAKAVLESYFEAINACDYSGAYSFLSLYDKRHITRESFVDWRKSVARLYPMRDFKITSGLPSVTVKFNDGKSCMAYKYRVIITEENIADGCAQSGEVEKVAIHENRMWRVFLGYQGVGELTRGFEERFEVRRKHDIARRWNEYCTGLYQEYDMLSVEGMRKAATREIYRQKRFGGTLTFAAVSVKAGDTKGNGQDELLRSTARTIAGSLRETDVPAYIGDGVFTILFVELQGRDAEGILGRLSEKIRKNAGPLLGGKAAIVFEYESWSGRSLAGMDVINRVLRKFHKKM